MENRGAIWSAATCRRFGFSYRGDEEIVGRVNRSAAVTHAKAATGRRTPNCSLPTIILLCLSVVGCGHHTAAVPSPSPSPPAANERLLIAYNGEEGKTALDILKARAQVRTSTSSLGELVEEINGMKSSEHEHLLFFVNGEMSKVGAGGYVTKQSDRIEWKLVGPKNSNPGGKK
jgi:hypothetical protein